MAPYFSGPWRYLPARKKNRRQFAELGSEICLYDLGAAGGMPPPFCFVPEAVHLVNFEPDRRLETEVAGQTLPVAIGPGNLNRLFLNRRPTTSSLLRANKQVTDRYDWSALFRDSADIFQTVATQEVETFGLDEIIAARSLRPPDFLKIDVQGLSLEVLQSGVESLNRDVIGILIEVEFLESYQGQKTFGAVHEFLYSLDFEVFRLTNLNPWYYKTGFPLKMRTGQDTFCDLLYFRRIDTVGGNGFWTTEKARQALRLMLLFDLTDAAAALLGRFMERGLLGREESARLRRLICDWTGALGYFFWPGNWWTALMDLSPGKALGFLKSRLGRIRR